MAWKPDYVTAAELKTYLRISGSSDDTLIGVCVTSASRAVDHACGRQFGKLAAAAPFLYQWDGRCIDGYAALPVDDLMVTTNLAVEADGTALTVDTDYVLWPYDAPTKGKPWTHLLRVAGGEGWPVIGGWPATQGALVEVTAIFGWTAVPAEVKQATYLQAARLYAARNAPYGIAGSPDQGSELRLLERLDPNAAAMVRTLRHHSLWAAA